MNWGEPSVKAEKDKLNQWEAYNYISEIWPWQQLAVASSASLCLRGGGTYHPSLVMHVFAF